MMKLTAFFTVLLSLLSMGALAQSTGETAVDALVPSIKQAPAATLEPPADGTQKAVSAPPSPTELEILEQVALNKPATDLTSMPSLFFSVWEHDLILDARRGLNTRPSGQSDGTEAQSQSRDISLSGIVYRSSEDWTVWLNSMRISPERIPTQVMDIKVFKDYIELEWFDEETNKIFPIRLRTYQRFNLDSRIFLPG